MHERTILQKFFKGLNDYEVNKLEEELKTMLKKKRKNYASRKRFTISSASASAFSRLSLMTTASNCEA